MTAIGVVKFLLRNRGYFKAGKLAQGVCGMRNDFAIAGIEVGQLNALVKNLKAQMSIEDSVEAVRRVNSGEWIVSERVRRWYEKDGVIRFEVTANGWSGQHWVDYFKANGVDVGQYANSILLSPDFKITPGGTVVKATVFKGEIFSDSDRITGKIRAFVARCQLKLLTPNTDLACLIRKDLTNKEVRDMGLRWIIGMSETVKDSDGGPSLLCSRCDGSGPWLTARYGFPECRWLRGIGFAFVE